VASRHAGTRRAAGRLFLQVHYGRRDLAQRIRTTDVVHHLDDAASLGRDAAAAHARRAARAVLLRRLTGPGRGAQLLVPPDPLFARREVATIIADRLADR
jgi:CHASE1-domain containing sensor protein